jgi:preprotein translocase subunit SecF
MASKNHKKEKKRKFSSDKIEAFLDSNYKKLMLIPIAFFVFAIIILSVNYANTGEIISRGITLKGGVSITLNKPLEMSRTELEDSLSLDYPNYDIVVRALRSPTGAESFIIESSIDESQVDAFIATVEEILGELKENEYSVETISSSLSERFFAQVVKALIWAFVLMAIVVFIYFKKVVPSLAVILSAVADIVGTLAITNLLGFKISTAGVAAFLMLIGYSVDSDILLTTRMIKRKIGTLFERVKVAFSTGIIMAITTLTAVGLAFLFSTSDVIRQIMAIIFIGILIDLINTWFLNVGLLRMYLERKK